MRHKIPSTYARKLNCSRERKKRQGGKKLLTFCRRHRRNSFFCCVFEMQLNYIFSLNGNLLRENSLEEVPLSIALKIDNFMEVFVNE